MHVPAPDQTHTYGLLNFRISVHTSSILRFKQSYFGNPCLLRRAEFDRSWKPTLVTTRRVRLEEENIIAVYVIVTVIMIRVWPRARPAAPVAWPRRLARLRGQAAAWTRARSPPDVDSCRLGHAGARAGHSPAAPPPPTSARSSGSHPTLSPSRSIYPS